MRHFTGCTTARNSTGRIATAAEHGREQRRDALKQSAAGTGHLARV
jgi:hypothetical protein